MVDEILDKTLEQEAEGAEGETDEREVCAECGKILPVKRRDSFGVPYCSNEHYFAGVASYEYS